METNWLIIILVIIAVIVLIVIFIIRNQKDKKDLVQELLKDDEASTLKVKDTEVDPTE